MGGHVVTEQMGNCKVCGKYEDLRGGFCFDCAHTKCPRHHCPFRKLGFNSNRQRVWGSLCYIDGTNVYCDRPEGLCSDKEYAIGLDKEPSLPPVDRTHPLSGRQALICKSASRDTDLTSNP